MFDSKCFVGRSRLIMLCVCLFSILVSNTISMLYDVLSLSSNTTGVIRGTGTTHHFGLIRLGLESTIYHTGGEHANHYTTDVVDKEEG
jgi:hypothetical protein